MEKAKASSTSRSIVSMFKAKVAQPEGAITSEALWAMFVAKHNIPFLTSDHANKLFPKMFPDSELAKQFSCGRTKPTAIVKQALAPHFLDKVTKDLTNPFSILMDESNDKTDKSCIILVRMFDSSVGDSRTRFLDMPIVNVGTAVNLFSALKSSLESKGLDFSRAVAFMSDTTNVMKGARSGVQKLIKDEHPHLYDVGCICHLADLTVKAGLKALPIDIDQLFIDVFYHFFHSSKRKQQFCDLWCSLFTTEPDVILKHCPTRWLSLLRCVGRYLSQYDGLKSYFLSCDEQSAKVRSISERLGNPLTRPLLLFLSFILPSIDRFNRVFQKSTENTTCQLYYEISRLVRLYASNLLTKESIAAVSEDLRLLNLERVNQLPDENLGVGESTWACLRELEEEYDLKPFFEAVRSFYVSSIKKMLNKFPFGDTLLKDLGILQPDKTASYPVSTIISLAKRFPQLGLDNAASLDELREEFLDFSLSPSDLAADGTMKPKAGSFWVKVGKLRTLDGKPRFSKLFHLMAGLLSIPVSNADSERGFSLLRKIHTDQRSNLSQSTIIALMSIKFNSDCCCHDAELPQELLQKCKNATLVTLGRGKR